MSTAQSDTNFLEANQFLEDEASVWYLKVISDVKNELEEDDSVEKMCDGLKNIMKLYLKNNIVLDDVFNRAWNISYTSIIYKQLDNVVCTTVQPMVMHLKVVLDNPERKRSINDSLKMLQLYHTVRNLVNYTLPCIPGCILRMDDYSDWFGEEMVLEWFLLCDLFTQQFIRKAVLADTMERLSKNLVYGTSVPDVTSVIDEMVMDVWIKLKWKDQFYTHGALIEAVKTCVLDYSKNTLDRLKMESYYCPTKEFEITPKLCVALNNIYAMSEHLAETKKKIRMELTTAEMELGTRIGDPLLGVQAEMQLIMAHIYLKVVKKIQKRLKELTKQTVNTNIDFMSEGSHELCLFIDNGLEQFYSNLKFDAFYVLLRHMWIVVLNSLKNGLDYTKGCFVTHKRKMKIYMITLQTLNQARKIFLCDGHGLSSYEIENSIYEGLRSTLEVQMQRN